MAIYEYTAGKARLLSVYLAAGVDLRAALLMTDTTVDTQDATIGVLSDFTDLDEFDGAGYSRQALGSASVEADGANGRGELHCADLAFGTLGAGTREIQGVLIYEHQTDDDDAVPIEFIEFTSPVTADGTSFTLEINAEGVLHVT